MKYQTNYGNEKSKTCLSRTGEPLTVYYSESAAHVGARYVNTASLKLVPYKCPKCGKWHLSPADRITPNTIGCRCKDSHNQPKALYKTRESAQQRAEIIYEERGQMLYVYPCLSHLGWHLSHTKYRGE
jgi:hypothetical protein